MPTRHRAASSGRTLLRRKSRAKQDSAAQIDDAFFLSIRECSCLLRSKARWLEWGLAALRSRFSHEDPCPEQRSFYQNQQHEKDKAKGQRSIQAVVEDQRNIFLG